MPQLRSLRLARLVTFVSLSTVMTDWNLPRAVQRLRQPGNPTGLLLAEFPDHRRAGFIRWPLLSP